MYGSAAVIACLVSESMICVPLSRELHMSLHMLSDSHNIHLQLIGAHLSLVALLLFFFHGSNNIHHMFNAAVGALYSGRMASTWSTWKASKASSSSVRPRTPKGSGWNSLRWPCVYCACSKMSLGYLFFFFPRKHAKISYGEIIIIFFNKYSSNIKPERATANQHDFQMHTFEKNTNCRACKMLLRWEHTHQIHDMTQDLRMTGEGGTKQNRPQ